MSAKPNTDIHKAQILANLAEIKRGPNPRNELLALKARWEEGLAQYKEKEPQLHELLKRIGAEPNRVEEVLGEFPAWVETQIQLALAEVGE